MKYFFKQDKIVKMPENICPQSVNFSERFMRFVPLTPGQEAFYLENPKASVEEIFKMKLNPPVAPAELRRRAYEKEIPRELMDSYITYSAEGKKTLAEEVAQKIAQIKQRIRERYPD